MISEHVLSVLLTLSSAPNQGHKQDVTQDTIIVVTVKKGEGCMETFARTKYPLGPKGCDRFFQNLGRQAYVDERVPMMRVIRDPLLYLGEEFAYYPKIKMWVPLDKD